MTTPALEAALEAEHAALYVYAALGGRASVVGDDALVAAIEEAYEAHVAVRDALVPLVGGAEEVPPAAAYELPMGISTAAGIRAAALGVERACTAALLAAVADASGEDRAALVTALGDAAVRQLGFGGGPADLPGT